MRTDIKPHNELNILPPNQSQVEATASGVKEVRLFFLCGPALFSLSHCLIFTTPVYEEGGVGKLGERWRAAGRERNAEGMCQGEDCQHTLRFLSGQLKLLASRRPYRSVWSSRRAGCTTLPSPTKTVQCGTKSSLSKECFSAQRAFFLAFLSSLLFFSCVPFSSPPPELERLIT